MHKGECSVVSGLLLAMALAGGCGKIGYKPVEQSETEPDGAVPEDASDFDATPRCVVNAPINLGVPCAQQCQGQAADSDCDGLADAIDPLPTICNSVRLFEAFDQGADQRWTYSSASWACGRATVQGGGSLLLNDPRPFPDNRNITVFQFTLGATSNPDNYKLVVRDARNDDSTQYRECSLIHDPNFVDPDFPKGIFLVVQERTSWWQGFYSFNEFDGADGTRYTLLLYSSGADHYCQLFTSDNALLLSARIDPASQPTVNVPTPGTLELQATGREFHIESVGVFAE
jgi:hypothetical protein